MFYSKRCHLLLRFIYCIVFITNASSNFNIAGYFPNTVEGNDEKAAFLMAIRAINNKSDGVLDQLLPGVKLLFTVKTSDGSSSSYLDDAKYISELSFNQTGVIACISSVNDAETRILSQIFDIYNIIHINSGSSASYLNNIEFYSNLYRIQMSDTSESIAIANIVSTHFQWSKVSLFYTTDSNGMNDFIVFQKYAQKLGIHILSSFSIDPGQTDFQSVISSAKSYRSRIFILFMGSIEAFSFLEAGYKSNLFFTGCQLIGSSTVMSSYIQSITNIHINHTAIPPHFHSDILKGYLGVIPAFGINISFHQDFVRLWKLQEDTMRVTSAGKVLCDNITTDDDGNLLYTSSVRAGECSGVQFSAVPPNGSTIATYAPHTYDATVTLATALHQLLFGESSLSTTTTTSASASISPQSYKSVLQADSNILSDNVISSNYHNWNTSNIISRMKLQSILTNIINISGVTGRISFSAEDPYIFHGDRWTGLKYHLLNFQDTSTSSVSSTKSVTNSSRSITWSLQTVGLWTDEKGFIPCSEPTCTIQYNTDDNSKPCDSPPAIKKSTNIVYIAVVAILHTFCTSIILLCSLAMLKYRKSVQIKASQPKLLLLLLLGGIIICFRGLISVYKLSDSICQAKMWLTHVGIIMFLSPLLVKILRLQDVKNISYKRMIFKENELVFSVMIILLLIMAYLSILTVYYPSYLSYITVTEENGQQSEYSVCTSHPDTQYRTGLYVLEGICIGSGLLFGWIKKDYVDAVGEANYLAKGTCL